jgi:hypothetical protein
MRSFFTLSIALIAVISFSITASSQSVLNPADPVVTYDSTKPPPAQPAWGQIGKWVRTVRMTWNTDDYKCYIYKGIAFRLKFPKTYQPGVADGKKYPMLVFFHGLGEIDTTTDNEFHLLWGAQMFRDAVNNGTFDGYVLFMQAQGFWGNEHYDAVKELIDYMVVNNKLDPFQVIDNGLSSGGQGTWELYFKYPTYVNAVMPMSSVAWFYGSRETVDKVKFTPIWNVHGGLDGSPAPYTAFLVNDSMQAAGANYRNTMYPNANHDSWEDMWREPDFWPFINRAYASNPWALYGQKDFCSAGTVGDTLGLVAGYDEYQWRKDGVLIQGATTNKIYVTQAGTYDARVRRGTLWSEWSRIPVKIRVVNCPGAPSKIEAENYNDMLGVLTETTADTLGGLNVGWQDTGDWMDYLVSLSAAGNYTIKLRVASQYGGSQVQIRRPGGTVLKTVTVPKTGGWQTWQTIVTQVSLPAGDQRLRIFTSAANGGWNLNWLQLQMASPTNKPATVNAGADQSLTLPASTAKLNGSATDDGPIAYNVWTQVSGPVGVTFGSPDSLSTSLGGLVEGSYVFRLTVTDNEGLESSDDVAVSVKIPTSSNKLHVEAESYSAMNGIQTEQTADTLGGLNVGWQDTGDWMDYNVNIPTAGTYPVNFRVATNNTSAQFQVRNQSGTVLATVAVPNTGGWQTWKTTTANVTLPAGAQTLRIYTSNANGGWNINWFDILLGGTTTNQPPTVNAGTDKTITLPTNSVSLTGTASDADGTISTYAWSRVSGPSAVTFSAPNAASTTASGLVQGTYVLRLTVTDNGGASASDEVTITVNAASPSGSIHIEAESYTAMSGIQTENTADAGGGLNVGWQENGDWMDYSVNIPTAGTYPVSFRVATPNAGAQFQVRKSDGTVLSIVTLPNTGWWQTWQTITVTIPLPAGQQTLRIITTDAKSTGWNINWWEITLNSVSTNQPPIVNAGMDQTIVLPMNSITLNGSASDPDGSITTYAWTKISGPAGSTFGSASSVSTTVNGLVQGSYVFRLTATDNKGATASDDVAITVNAAGTKIHIEAESYTAMSGIQTENTADAGGGLNVGWQENGDWMDYYVNVPSTGTYTLNFRVATPNAGAQFQLRKQDGTVLAIVTLPNTGWWQTWQTITAQVSLPQGGQTIRIITTDAKGTGWNLNWWDILTGTTAGLTAQASRSDITALNTDISAVNVYPNPVTSNFKLTVNNNYTGKLNVQIINANGTVVKTINLPKVSTGATDYSISVPELRRGVYIIQATMNGWKANKRIIRQ